MKLSAKQILCYVGIINIMAMVPSVIPLLLPLPGPQILVFCFILFYILILLNKRQINNLPDIVNFIILIQGSFWLLMSVYHRDGSYLTRIAYLVNAYLFLLCLTNSQDSFEQFIKGYIKVMVGMAILGCVAFLGVMIFKFQPIANYVNMDSRPGYFYGITCTNAKFGDFIRYSGFFDEPGSMAFWGTFAIIFNIIVLHNRRLGRILFYCISLTFSLAYYIQMSTYILFQKLNNLKMTMTIVIVIMSLFWGIKQLEETEYAQIYKLTLGRLELSEDGTVAGDNRSDLMQNALTIFKKKPLLGIGATNFSQLSEYGGDNPMTPFAMDGIIGCVVLYLPLLLAFPFCVKHRKLIACWFVLLIGYFQRPFSCFYIYFITLYIFFIICYNEETKSNNNHCML